MNVIFLDFDGVLNTLHCDSNEEVEKKIELLSKICKENNCKIVIEAAAKTMIDEETLKTESYYIQKIFKLFNKYGIECIGRTPCVSKKISKYSVYPIWKEFEIRKYLFNHPEIEHFCVIDDGDLSGEITDLKQLEDYLIHTKYYSKDPQEEGLLESHKDEISKILKKENNIRKLILKYKK